MLTDETYFNIGALTVPGILSVNSGADFEAELDRLIAKYEPEFLRRILGTELYIKYVAEANPIVSGSRWDKLINGTAYTDIYGKDNLWDGLIRSTIKCSPIANYVFRKYLEMKVSETMISGEKANEAENAKNAALENKIVPIWNEMVGWNIDMDLFLKSYSIAGVIQFPEYRTYGLPFWNNLEYNIEPDFMYSLQSRIRRESTFIELFETINQFGF